MAAAAVEDLDVKTVLSNARATVDELIAVRRDVHRALARRNPVEHLLAEFGKEIAKALPNESAAETRRGVLHWVLGHLEAAVTALSACRASKEKFFFLGTSHLELDRPMAAVEPLREAYDSDHEDMTVAKAYTDALLRAGDVDGGEKMLDRLEKKLENDADVQYLRGLWHDARGDLYKGLECFEEVLENDPGHARALFRIAYMLDLKGEDPRALEYYMQLRKMEPMHVNTMINLGVLFEDRGEYDKAIECYKSILTFFPNHPRAKLYLSDASASLDMYYDEDAVKKEAKLKQLLGQNLVDFQWSRRVREAFNKIGVITVGELAAKSEEDLMEVPNFGRTSLNEVREFLTQKGLSLAYAEKSGGAVTTMEVDQDIFQRPLEEFEWSARVREFFDSSGLHTVGDLVRLSKKEILSEKAVGPASVKEIQDRVSTLGLNLREE